MNKKITLLFLSLLATTVVMSQTKPVLYFNFAGNVNDSSINHFATTSQGSVSYTNGRKSGANSALVSTSGAAVLTSNTGAYKTTFPFTIATWIKINQLGIVNPIFTNEDDQTTYSGIWLQVLGQGEVAANIGNAQAINSNGRLSAITNSPVITQTNTWYQIVVVATSTSDIKIYVNGVQAPSYLDGSATSLVYLNGSNNVAKVGSYNKGSMNNYYLDGAIDELALWNIALSGNELNDLLADKYINYTSVKTYSNNTFNVYPNPARNIATIVLPTNFNEGNTSLKIFDVLGNVVKEELISFTKTHSLQVENLAKGLYFVQLQNNGAVARQSIVIE